MTGLTDARRTALAHLSDGEWRAGRDLACSVTLGWLERRELIRFDDACLRMSERHYTITPDGLTALETSQ